LNSIGIGITSILSWNDDDDDFFWWLGSSTFCGKVSQVMWS
jgi:hypothetical protein